MSQKEEVGRGTEEFRMDREWFDLNCRLLHTFNMLHCCATRVVSLEAASSECLIKTTRVACHFLRMFNHELGELSRIEDRGGRFYRVRDVKVTVAKLVAQLMQLV